ncbi:TIGR03087 family PEP-CTERM/XrtA system glycosyltransferase [Hyphococcus sp.]|uniref:TIGR03087 family PEP-CTERM/XrtA system glycosyltransferase n=1 Tax=Hyphococcus sp. TaxID=2038636 RepID=UPI0020880976|nr:MAG: glycosyl transferase [Marinicaulis sp.]
MKEEILFLSHRIPYPPDKGDKIRSWRLLQHLTQRFRVHLACFVDDPNDFTHRDFLESICETVALVPLSSKLSRLKSLSGLVTGAPMSFSYFRDARMLKVVRAARTRPLLAEVVFSSTMAPYIEEPVAGRKRIVDFCDADSEKWREYSQQASWPLAPIYGREARRLAMAETKIANWADASFAITQQEAMIFNERAAIARPVDWFANGVDIDLFDPNQTPMDSACRCDCVFVGAMDYRANVEGVLNFAKHVWPLIRMTSPTARFAIVGANPDTKIARLHDANGIIVTGRVADVRPWLLGARIVIAPLLVARGIQNKVLEAMAMAKPVVASSGAMTGIDAPAHAVIIANDPQEVVNAVCELMIDDARCKTLGAAARNYVCTQFSWERSFVRLDQALERLGLHSSSSSSSAFSPPSSAN